MTDFQQLILLVIDHLGDNAYGVPIAEKLEELTWKRVSTGALYVNLESLEAEEFIISRLSDEVYPERGNRPRRYFTVTPKGKAECRKIKANLTATLEIAFGSV